MLGCQWCKSNSLVKVSTAVGRSQHVMNQDATIESLKCDSSLLWCHNLKIGIICHFIWGCWLLFSLQYIASFTWEGPEHLWLSAFQSNPAFPKHMTGYLIIMLRQQRSSVWRFLHVLSIGSNLISSMLLNGFCSLLLTDHGLHMKYIYS